MKRIILVASAAIFIMACAGLAYGEIGYDFTDGLVKSNEIVLGDYLDAIYYGGGALPTDLGNGLEDAVSGSAYLLALNSLSPEKYAALLEMNLGSFEQFNALALGRLASLRTGGVVAHNAKPMLFADSGAIMLDAAPFLYAPATDAGSGWGVWGEGFGLFGHQANRGGEFGYDYDTYGLSLGVDKAIGDRFVVGLFTGYSHSRIDFNDVSFDGDVNSFDLGLYAGYTSGAWYLDTSFTWARNWHETERYDAMAGVDAHGDYFGDVFASYLGGGYNIDLGKARITPGASLTYTYYNQPRFTETGADPFNLFVHRFDSHSLVSRIGLSFSYEFDLDNVTIVPEASAEWAHEYLDTDRTVVSRFGEVAGETFAVDGVTPDRDGALLGLGLTAYFGKGFAVYGDYNAEVRPHYNSHGFTIGLRYEF